MDGWEGVDRELGEMEESMGEERWVDENGWIKRRVNWSLEFG